MTVYFQFPGSPELRAVAKLRSNMVLPRLLIQGPG